MARKRKKSKGRKKRQKSQEAAPPEAAADDAGVPADEEADADHPTDEHPPADEDDAPDTHQPAEDVDEGEIASGETVAAVIEVDGELEDPNARAELIAAAAGLVDEDGPEVDGGEVEATDGDPAGQAETTDESAYAAPLDGTDEEKPSDEVADEAEPSGEGDDDREGGEDDATPLIGRDALIALSQFRDEGVATVPEELVLDLGDTTDPDERDRLLAAALAHVEMQEAIYRVPTESATTRRWKGFVAAAVLILAVFLAMLPPDLLVPAGPDPLTGADRLRGIRTALLVQAEQIEAFRVREGRLPTSLGELDTGLSDIRYVRSSDRLYQLVAYAPDGDAIIYDSAAPDAAFDAIGSPLLPEDPS